MAQFRGTISGGSGETSRSGTKFSGLMTECNGWNLGVTCFIEFNKKRGRDEVHIAVTTGSRKVRAEIPLSTWYFDRKTQKLTRIKR